MGIDVKHAGPNRSGQRTEVGSGFCDVNAHQKGLPCKAFLGREVDNACKCFVSVGRRSGHHTKQSGNGGDAIWTLRGVKWPCSPTTSFLRMHAAHNPGSKIM